MGTAVGKSHTRRGRSNHETRSVSTSPRVSKSCTGKSRYAAINSDTFKIQAALANGGFYICIIEGATFFESVKTNSPPDDSGAVVILL